MRHDARNQRINADASTSHNDRRLHDVTAYFIKLELREIYYLLLAFANIWTAFGVALKIVFSLQISGQTLANYSFFKSF